MDVVIIVLLVFAALAAVLYPIFRAREESAGARTGIRHGRHRAPAAKRRAARPAASGRTPTPATAAVVTPPPPAPGDVAAEVARYRAALRAGTLCHRCAEANEAGSRFCARCGGALAPEQAEAGAEPGSEPPTPP
jgi:hypothetical protein